MTVFAYITGILCGFFLGRAHGIAVEVRRRRRRADAYGLAEALRKTIIIPGTERER